MSKRAARQELLVKRRMIAPERRLMASTEATASLSTRLTGASFVLSYASFDSELDMWPLNRVLASSGRLVLPKLVEESLRLFSVKDFDYTLSKHRWGFLEPIPALCQEVSVADINIALIPGLGFDLATGHRLGYGKGHYDRLLANFSSKALLWGVGFKEQALSGLSFDSHDIPLTTHHLF